jgi:hypothetical protein
MAMPLKSHPLMLNPQLSLKAVTLLELLIAITLVGFLAIGIWSIDLFSRYHLRTSERRGEVQNKVSYVLEHIGKEIGKAIGDANNPAIDLTSIAGDTAIRIYVDLASNGQSAGDGRRGTEGDRWRVYRYYDSGYQIRYYANYVNLNSSYEVISNKITAFNPSLSDNYVFIEITACWDPTESSYACGSPDNPDITMKTRIKMPSVSVN